MIVSVGPKPPTVNISPPGPITGALVGDPLIIYCVANTTETLDIDLVAFRWTKFGGGTIASNNRVTINPATSSGNNHTSSIQFAYLMEGDEGMYNCDVTILTISGSQNVELESLTSKLHKTSYFVYYFKSLTFLLNFI